jgi:hypothetical protein
MSKIKGQNFRLFVGSNPIPEETSLSITLQGNSDDTSTKDVVGLYSQDTVVTTSWTAQVDSYQAEPEDWTSLVALFNAAQPLTVGWDQTAGSQNRVAQNANFAREGEALLNDLTLTFNDRQPCQVSIQLQGTGNLS